MLLMLSLVKYQVSRRVGTEYVRSTLNMKFETCLCTVVTVLKTFIKPLDK